jgi:GDPmannose 4,6-dehydratase
MKALIFGASGQDGYYLSASCRRRGIEVVGISRSASEGNHIKADISSYEQVEAIIRYHLPDFVFHLAANSTTNHAALLENHHTICTGTVNVLESVLRYCPKAKVFITGSGLQFVNKGCAISEKDPFQATSAYALSRIQSVYAARYFRSLGLQVYVGYLFHHESPRRKLHHVSKKIAWAARQIASGQLNTLEIGDISVRKEWTFAGDVVEGILTLVFQDDVYEATIGSGVPYSIQDWLELCFEFVGLDWQKYVVLKEGFKAEYSCLFSNPATINSLHWSPSVDFPSLAKMMMTSDLSSC